MDGVRTEIARGFEAIGILHMAAPSMRQELHYLQGRHKINCKIILVAFLQVVQLLPQACCLPLPELLVKQEVLSVSELQNISVDKYFRNVKHNIVGNILKIKINTQ